ncbi:hypothetical protein B0H14DRAFT_3126179 [Mycena olivaceomarginata]|nr:hypothetical protein B0H14DRAFT_3126179 [Mycena olivaceomarginata]
MLKDAELRAATDFNGNGLNIIEESSESGKISTNGIQEPATRHSGSVSRSQISVGEGRKREADLVPWPLWERSLKIWNCGLWEWLCRLSKLRSCAMPFDTSEESDRAESKDILSLKGDEPKICNENRRFRSRNGRLSITTGHSRDLPLHLEPPNPSSYRQLAVRRVGKCGLNGNMCAASTVAQAVVTAERSHASENQETRWKSLSERAE